MVAFAIQAVVYFEVIKKPLADLELAAVFEVFG
jgi:hypothetical protein